MKKIIVICALMLVLCLPLCSCEATVSTQEDVVENGSSNISMFIWLEKTENWGVVYHKDTKVLYVVSLGYRNSGIFSPLFNADGTLMLYGGV